MPGRLHILLIALLFITDKTETLICDKGVAIRAGIELKATSLPGRFCLSLLQILGVWKH